MKKIKIIILTFLLFIQSIIFLQANAIDCHPAYNWNWTVTTNCTWPDWYKVYGNIYVWDYTITMWANDDMWIDLSSNKITFNNWKINLDTTAKIANHVSSRYYIAISYNTTWNSTDCDSSNSWNQCTACPSWMYAFNTETAPASNWTTGFLNNTTKDNPGPYNTDNSNHRLVNSTGTLYCWTRWS